MTHGNRDLGEREKLYVSEPQWRLFLLFETKGSTCSFCSGSYTPRSRSYRQRLSNTQWADRRPVRILISQPRKWSCWEHHKDPLPSGLGLRWTGVQDTRAAACPVLGVLCPADHRGSVSRVSGSLLWGWGGRGEEALSLGSEDLGHHSRSPILQAHGLRLITSLP